MLRYGTVWYGMSNSIVRYSVVWCGVVWYGMAGLGTHKQMQKPVKLWSLLLSIVGSKSSTNLAGAG